MRRNNFGYSQLLDDPVQSVLCFEGEGFVIHRKPSVRCEADGRWAHWKVSRAILQGFLGLDSGTAAANLILLQNHLEDCRYYLTISDEKKLIRYLSSRTTDLDKHKETR